MKYWFTIIGLLIGISLCTAMSGFLTFSERCENVQSEVLRLHLPANSNSEEDQWIKLQLRDFILSEYGEILSECGNLSDAEKTTQRLLPEIEARATEFLRENGFSYSAKAELVDMYFTTREYERLILPAGEYRALRITLGTGEGQNWWCVIFPQLCLPCVTEQSDPDNAQAVLDTFGKPQKVKVKFAVYELFQCLTQ